MEAGQGGRQLLWLDGFVPLPVGAVIELARRGGDPAANAEVVGIRLSAAESVDPLLVLDVVLSMP